MATFNRSGKPETPKTRINKQITARQVRLIDSDGEQGGVMETVDAMNMAENLGLDLVEVAPNAKPPVCRIMDYGQYKYKQAKRQHEAKKNQKIVHIKEIKMRPKTDQHDFEFKVKRALEFISKGDKVKVTVMFRGREMTHREIGMELLKKVSEMVEEAAVVEAHPKNEGRTMFMVVAPKKK